MFGEELVLRKKNSSNENEHNAISDDLNEAALIKEEYQEDLRQIQKILDKEYYNHLKSKSNELMVENAKLRAVSLPGIVCAGTWQKKEEKRKAKVKDQATNSKEGETVVQVD